MTQTTHLDRVSGRNASHSVFRPHERDSTRGNPDLSACPSMHRSEVKDSTKLSTCQCCGLLFGYNGDEKKQPIYCPSHQWLTRARFLGQLILEDVVYKDPYNNSNVRGRLVTWIYKIPYKGRKEAEQIQTALRDFIRECLLEKYEERVPRIEIEKEYICLARIHRICYDHNHREVVDTFLMERIIHEFDKVVVNAL